jgi:hypothetical protein
MARLVFRAYAQTRRRFGIPASVVTAILADDFEAEIRHSLPSVRATHSTPATVA